MVQEGIPLLIEGKPAACSASSEAWNSGGFQLGLASSMRLFARQLLFVTLALFTLLGCLNARATQSVPLAWEPSPGSNVFGYAIYYGKTSTVYDSRLDVGTNILALV